MNLDDILSLAAEDVPTELDRARARRATRIIEQEYQRAVADGRDLLGDIDLHDPLASDSDEAVRIARAAQLAKLGTVTWNSATRELTWSDEMSLIFGYPPGTARPSARLLFSLIHPEDVDGVRRVIVSAWREQTVKETTYRVIRPDRVTRYVHCYVEVFVDDADRPRGIIGTGQDVTELELARQERDRLARRYETVRTELTSRDPVTGLLTRPRFADEIDRAQRAGSGTLLVVAVEPVNAPGTRPGTADQDRLAAAIADVIRNAARRADVCGLVGPNEFGVLMHHTDMPSAEPLAEHLVRRLRTQSFVPGQTRVRLDAWAGLAGYRASDEHGSFELFIDAESAWRRAKREGVPLVALRQPPPPDERQATCLSRVRAAIADNSFTLYAQPILDLRLNQITRQEILLRLLDDTGSPVPPSAFLDVAERINEIQPIDRWVIDHALELIAQGPRTSHYQINISGRSLSDPDLLAHIHRLIRQYDLDASQVTFEITETALIGNLTEAVNFAHGIRNIGCRLALDDFGSGYGSFTYLKYFPVDLVKIDGDFVSGICDSRTDQVMVRSFVGVCAALGIRTAAEYVEDRATLELLRDYGVDFAQGYEVGKPRPVATAHRPASEEAEREDGDPRPRLRAALG